MTKRSLLSVVQVWHPEPDEFANLILNLGEIKCLK